MNTKFSLALLASAAMAKSHDHVGAAFQDFAGKYNKNYDTLGSMLDHMRVWMDNKDTVDNLNKANEGTGVTFALNSTSDLTDAEYKKTLGLKESKNGPPPRPPKSDTDSTRLGVGRGRHLEEDMTINWVERGKVGPVKNQGEVCGSCWAHTATTVQEAMQAIKMNSPVVRLSEQEGIDCDKNSWGCDGGEMYSYWEMSSKIGSQAYSEYKYEAKDKRCRNQKNKKVISRANWDTYVWHDTVDEMRQQIQKGPLSIAVNSDSDCWRYYESGILSSANNCPTANEYSDLNHGVVAVALVENVDMPYWIIQNSLGEEWGNEGFIWLAVEEENNGVSGMNYQPESIDVYGVVEDEEDGDGDGDDDTNYEEVCRWAKRWERKNKQCDYDDEYLAPNRRGNRKNRRCCWMEAVESPFQL